MPTISVRISDEEKKRLLKYGPLSESVRKALELYIRERKAQEVLDRLEELQRRNPIRLDPVQIVRMIREDRAR